LDLEIDEVITGASADLVSFLFGAVSKHVPNHRVERFLRDANGDVLTDTENQKQCSEIWGAPP
jgi:hypothetical protein